MENERGERVEIGTYIEGKKYRGRYLGTYLMSLCEDDSLWSRQPGEGTKVEDSYTRQKVVESNDCPLNLTTVSGNFIFHSVPTHCANMVMITSIP